VIAVIPTIDLTSSGKKLNRAINEAASSRLRLRAGG